MTTAGALQSLIVQGESETLELKRSTADLKRAGETLCAFLNGEGGKVLIGVVPDGKLVGQDAADITLRDIAEMLGRFEPASPHRVVFAREDMAAGARAYPRTRSRNALTAAVWSSDSANVSSSARSRSGMSSLRSRSP